MSRVYDSARDLLDRMESAEEPLAAYVRLLTKMQQEAAVDLFVAARVKIWLDQAHRMKREMNHCRDALAKALEGHDMIDVDRLP